MAGAASALLSPRIAAGTVAAVLLNILFHHIRPKFAFGHAAPAGELGGQDELNAPTAAE